MVWPVWVRILVAVAIVVAFFHVYAGWHWSERIGSGPGVWFSPTGAYVGRQSALTLAVKHLNEVLEASVGTLYRFRPFTAWRMAYALSTVLPAALLGVIAYEILTRRFGRARAEHEHPRCRRCRYILKGLTEPRCPECGERI